jgi:hypothetical protein
MADKSAVRSFFRSHPNTWVSAADIVSAVGDVPDRTLRNWLHELVEDGSIEPKGQRKGRRYLLRARPVVLGTGQPPLQGQPAAIEAIFSANSLALIRRLEAPLYDRPPATYREVSRCLFECSLTLHSAITH